MKNNYEMGLFLIMVNIKRKANTTKNCENYIKDIYLIINEKFQDLYSHMYCDFASENYLIR